MKILVTGGAGFIGSPVVRNSNNIRHTVVNEVKLSTLNQLVLHVEIKNNHKYYLKYVAVCDKMIMGHILASHKLDTVKCLAAKSYVELPISGSAALIERV
ncbi:MULTISPECIES: GDP-mannose 4,6-dehydratase [Citrobacter]|uniref:GDP-mannose 4,6-dehydratase n=1 Tax=Citrobacter meridianamericanus TaxID=2894201 RepID=A0ABT1B3G8_9ENTR|nr:GDP-mannose 4,6-dehydratase [Citrobacter meridianamericanus]